MNYSDHQVSPLPPAAPASLSSVLFNLVQCQAQPSLAPQHSTALLLQFNEEFHVFIHTTTTPVTRSNLVLVQSVMTAADVELVSSEDGWMIGMQCSLFKFQVLLQLSNWEFWRNANIRLTSRDGSDHIIVVSRSSSVLAMTLSRTPAAASSAGLSRITDLEEAADTDTADTGEAEDDNQDWQTSTQWLVGNENQYHSNLSDDWGDDDWLLIDYWHRT